MSGSLYRGICGLLCALSWTASAVAIETTYGEDPVPNSKCYDGFINLGYGIDPIPAKSPYVRWQEWRAARGLAPTVGPFKRQVGESRYQVRPAQPEFVPPPEYSATRSPQRAAPQGSKRNARTRNLPYDSGVR